MVSSNVLRLASSALVTVILSLATTSDLAAQPGLAISGFHIDAVTSPSNQDFDYNDVALNPIGARSGDIYATRTSGSMPGGFDILRVPRGGGPEELAGSAPFAYPKIAFTPNGHLFFVTANGQGLYELSPSGTRSQLAMLPRRGSGITYSDSGPYAGKLLIAQWANYLSVDGRIWSYDPNEPNPTLRLGVVQDFLAVGLHEFGPLGIDTMPGSAFGTDLYTLRLSLEPGNERSRIVRLDGTTLTIFTAVQPARTLAFPPLGSPFGDYLYVFTFAGEILRVDPSGTSSVFANGFSNGGGHCGLEFSADGHELFVAPANANSPNPNPDPRLYRIAADGFATRTYRNGSGINPYGFRCVTSPVLGASWDTTVDTTPMTASTWLGLSGTQGQLPLLGGEVLLGVGSGLFMVQGAGSYSIPIPNDAMMLGIRLSSQGIRVDSTTAGPVISLLNAHDLVLGR